MLPLPMPTAVATASRFVAKQPRSAKMSSSARRISTSRSAIARLLNRLSGVTPLIGATRRAPACSRARSRSARRRRTPFPARARDAGPGAAGGAGRGGGGGGGGGKERGCELEVSVRDAVLAPPARGADPDGERRG